MKNDRAVGDSANEGQSEEDFRRNTFQFKAGWVFEAKLPVVIGMSHNTAPGRAKLLQSFDSFPNQSGPYALPLMWR